MTVVDDIPGKDFMEYILSWEEFPKALVKVCSRGKISTLGLRPRTLLSEGTFLLHTHTHSLKEWPKIRMWKRKNIGWQSLYVFRSQFR